MLRIYLLYAPPSLALDGLYLSERYLWTEWITRLIEMISGQVHLTSCCFCSQLFKLTFFFFFPPSPHRPCSQMHSLFVQLPNCTILQPPHQLSSNRKNWLCSGNDQALISAWEHILWFPSLKVNLHSELSPQHLARDGLHVKICDWLYFKGHQ